MVTIIVNSNTIVVVRGVPPSILYLTDLYFWVKIKDGYSRNPSVLNTIITSATQHGLTANFYIMYLLTTGVFLLSKKGNFESLINGKKYIIYVV